MSSRDQVDSLLAIIKEAAYNALDEYETYGTPAPNLDSLEPHPLDVADDKLRLKKIISKLEGACDQLCTILAPPSHTVMNRAQDFGWACLRVSVRQKIADELAQHPDGLHVDELSKKVNVHPMKLASILRVLAARHCFREVLPNSFANNRLSMNLVSDHSVSALVNLVTEEGQRSALALSDYVVDPEYGYSLDISKAVFQYRNKDVMPKGLTFYEWLQSSEQKERRQVMMKAMIGMNLVIGSLSALHAYSWSTVKSVCDVGSGMGGFSRSLLEMYPMIHVTQFDLPQTLELAKKQWKDDFSGQVTFVEGDFFLHIPVPNCDIYYLRNILHNWSDEQAILILKSVREAMGPGSRALIREWDDINHLREACVTLNSDDHVLHHMSSTKGTYSEGMDVAPEPMLPNYGVGKIRLYHQDLTMMMCYNTKERTVGEMIALGEKAGLRGLKIFDLAEMCLIEFDKVD